MAAYMPPELSRYADQIVSVSGRTIAVKDLAYVSAQDYYTTAMFKNTGGLILANQEQTMFTAPPGSVGQGATVALTTSESNASNGNKFEGNELMLVESILVDFYMCQSTGDFSAIPNVDAATQDVLAAAATTWLTSHDILGLGKGMFVTYQNGGGPERVIGACRDFPAGSASYTAAVGAFGVTLGFQAAVYEASASNGGPNVPIQKFGELLCLCPNVAFLFKVKNKVAVPIRNNGTSSPDVAALAVKFSLRGWRMTLPV